MNAKGEKPRESSAKLKDRSISFLFFSKFFSLFLSSFACFDDDKRLQNRKMKLESAFVGNLAMINAENLKKSESKSLVDKLDESFKAKKDTLVGSFSLLCLCFLPYRLSFLCSQKRRK